MARAREDDELQASPGYRVAWTSTPANYDIVENDPVPGDSKDACRAIIVAGSGTLVVTGIDGTNVTLPDMGQPWQFDIQATNLVASGSTATNVLVLW